MRPEAAPYASPSTVRTVNPAAGTQPRLQQVKSDKRSKAVEPFKGQPTFLGDLEGSPVETGFTLDGEALFHKALHSPLPYSSRARDRLEAS